MLGLAKGEDIMDQIKVQSKMGHGILYLLNTRIAFEISGRGLCLELQYGEIIYSRTPKKDSIVISWAEGVGTYDIKFNVKNAASIAHKINQYKIL